MFKFVMALLLSLVSWAANANPGNEACVWALLGETEAMASNSAEFLELQIKFPRYFQNYDAQAVTSAHVRVREMEFIGGTVCEDNDPLLFSEFASYGICQKSGDRGSCFNVPMPVPPETDPCALP